MPLEGVPTDVRQFLDRCVDSLEQLEVLLLIRRSSGSALTAVTVARELGSTLESVKGRLRTLAVMGLAEEADGSYRYRSDPAHDAVVDLVAQAYRERRVSMITYIVNSRSKTLRAFSDAFRLRDPRSP